MEMEENPFLQKTYDEIKSMLGAILTEDNNTEYRSPTILSSVPESFDSRTTFKNCVHPIRD